MIKHFMNAYLDIPDPKIRINLFHDVGHGLNTLSCDNNSLHFVSTGHYFYDHVVVEIRVCVSNRAGPRGSRTRKRWMSGSRLSLVPIVPVVVQT